MRVLDMWEMERWEVATRERMMRGMEIGRRRSGDGNREVEKL